MLFNSYEFIFIFLPITFFIYFYLNSKRLIIASKGFLVFSSLFFYSWWNVAYLPLILVSMLFNYVIGNTLSQNNEEQKKGLNKTFSKKSILIFGIVANVSLLGYFKYADFFIENFNLVTNSNIELLHLLLPLAISFFTFQQIAYLVDSYKAETKEYDFLNYALFVTFFPQLIAGPIVHHKEMMPQFANVKNKVKNYRNIALGLFIFSIGLFKKVVIADTFAVWATAGFDTATTLNFFEAWATSLSYTFQLYFDFSGYTDMAIGIALLFNIKLPINFNSPYKALNIQDFWRRWHITLSRFLRDYVYIPLGGNKKGSFRTYNNLMATFIIGGFWHGAGWTFIFWGFLHGLALSVHRIWQNLGFKMWTWLAWLITFNFVNIAWVFFRAKEWDDAVKVLSSMFSLNNVVLHPMFESRLSSLKSYGVAFGGMFENISGSKFTVVVIILALLLVVLFKNSMEKRDTFILNYKTLILTAICLVGGILSLNKVSEFLYFNF
ncbi:D-alanyl-lipoteichoic acid acyltransferase DltB (MBOAT superfamily) [Malaciobacter marinus]|uniref:D-alanyl-lipoteichoic acid acyltransferase DltB (MBOAT superfamily) n=1 Tax=Malaciobacter marinus TaxID=505249 RepID=A0AB36ZSY2_9BACT|nr:MBOAT family protein [Malaciobacter marinus]PPK57116.1 D-alanyl-lipoteichoic acid acyltransferase DltB (MBOAT superfamily) [Malaciobacter marinus]